MKRRNISVRKKRRIKKRRQRGTSKTEEIKVNDKETRRKRIKKMRGVTKGKEE